MSNEELWRSEDDQIIPATAAMIVVPKPMGLALEVQGPEDDQCEVALEEAVAGDYSKEVVAEQLAVKEMAAEKEVREETAAVEHSSLWLEIDEVNICEPPSTAGQEGTCSEMSSGESAKESTTSW